MIEERKKILIITGSAHCTLQDIGDAIPEGPIGVHAYDFMAIGLDAVDIYNWPIQYMATFHPAEIPQIRKRREAVGGNLDYKVISHEQLDAVDIFIRDWWQPSGSSTLLGVQAAIQRLGYEKIILCGCPLTGKNKENGDYENFRKGWQANLDKIVGKVKSMSGWTREFLGAPTPEWRES